MVQAKISFTIYDDKYDKLVRGNNDGFDYNIALNHLNKELEELIKKNKLTFLYKNRRVKVIPYVPLKDTGNIFGDEKYISAQWESVDISCEIDCEYEDFDSTKLRASKYPDNFVPCCVLW